MAEDRRQKKIRISMKEEVGTAEADAFNALEVAVAPKQLKVLKKVLITHYLHKAATQQTWTWIPITFRRAQWTWAMKWAMMT